MQGSSVSIHTDVLDNNRGEMINCSFNDPIQSTVNEQIKLQRRSQRGLLYSKEVTIRFKTKHKAGEIESEHDI